MSDRSEWITLTYEENKRETDKAYLLVFNGDDYWIPKSQCEIMDDMTVEMSPWIIKQKGL